jgi:hypothetical protein
VHRRAAPTSSGRCVPEDPSIDIGSPETEKKMLLAVSLLSSIAQSRIGQWVRALALLQRRSRI